MSITFSSIKLFYSQRLGRHRDYDPSMKMMVVAALPVMFLIAGPLASLVCLASYFQDKVIVFIIVTTGINVMFLSSLYLKDELCPSIKSSYASYELNEVTEDDEKRAREDCQAIFLSAIFTTWISPCTVWANDIGKKSHFLLVSSATSANFINRFLRAVFVRKRISLVTFWQKKDFRTKKRTKNIDEIDFRSAHVFFWNHFYTCLHLNG